jgi:hypothetical protein
VDADDALLEHGHGGTGRSLLQVKKGERVSRSVPDLLCAIRFIIGFPRMQML